MRENDELSVLRAKIDELQATNERLTDEYANLYDAHAELSRSQERLIAQLLNYLEIESEKEKQHLVTLLKAAFLA